MQESIKMEGSVDGQTRENSNGRRPSDDFRITLVDSRTRPQWSSRSHPDGSDFWTRELYSFAIPAHQDLARRAFGRCIVEGETIVFRASAYDPLESNRPASLYELTLYPMQRLQGVGVGVAACVVTVPLRYDVDQLDEQDRLLLRLVAEDNTLKQVAEIMHRSESALDSRIKNLKTKLQQTTLPGLIATAIRNRII